MRFIRPNKEYLGFDARMLMLIGIPVLALMMPVMLDLYSPDQGYEYWTHQVPESLFFVIGFWIFYRELCIFLRRRFPLLTDTRKRIFYEFAIIVISAPILKQLLAYLIWTFLALCNIQDHDPPGNIQTLLAIFLPSGMILAIYEAVYFFVKYKDSILEKERLETAHVQTQLEILRNQINPHFLFNSLNTLMNLIPKDPDAAINYLSKLSKFYRFAVGTRDEKLIGLDKEIECARLYADLLKIRFGDAIAIDFDDLKPNGFQILPMSLQLLIENAVKHNVVSKTQPLNISVSLNEEQSYLAVKNNLQKRIQEVSSTGMGLQNISQRFSFFTEKPILIEHSNGDFSVALPIL